MLPDLLGSATGPVREATVHQSMDGMLAIRQGKWKLELCAGSGGWSAPQEAGAASQGLPAIQLYDMTQDVAEQNNLQSSHPEEVAKLTALLEKYIKEGRSTPGAAQKNDVVVPLRQRAAGNADGGT